MKKVLLSLTLLLATTGSAVASDCVWPYVGAIAGGSTGGSDNLKLSSGYQYGGLAGVEFCNARVEAEVAYRKNDADSLRGLPAGGTFSLMSYMVNGYYEFDVNSKVVRPYVGGGIGLGTADVSSGASVGGVPLPNSGSGGTKMVYQGIGGVGFFLTKNFVLDTTYRYFSSMRYDLGGVNAPYTTHNVVIGGRWRF